MAQLTEELWKDYDKKEYEHYHLTKDTPQGVVELVIINNDGRHEVVDWDGDIKGEKGKTIKKTNIFGEAVIYAYKEINKKFRMGQWIINNECPPHFDKLIQKVTQ